MKWFSKISKSDIIILLAVLTVVGVDLFSTHIFLGKDKEPIVEQTPIVEKDDRKALPPKEPPTEKNTSRFISPEDWAKLVDSRIFLKREPKVDTPKVLPQKKKKATKPISKPLVIKKDEPVRYININGRIYELNKKPSGALALKVRSNIFLVVFKWIGGLL